MKGHQCVFYPSRVNTTFDVKYIKRYLFYFDKIFLIVFIYSVDEELKEPVRFLVCHD